MKFFDILNIIIIAIIFQVIIYFGFDSAYFSYKHLEVLPKFFNENIYQYRIFSNLLFNQFYESISPILNSLRESVYWSKIFKTAGSNFYISLFLYNTIFVLSMIIVNHGILKLKNYSEFSLINKYLIHLSIIVLVSISQYVITPYDTASYFFLSLGIFWSIKYLNLQKIQYLIFLGALMFVSTLNRESSAINLSFLAAIIFMNRNLNFKNGLEAIKILFIPTLFFILAYVGIRFYFSDTEVIQGNYTVKNFLGFKNIFGMLFFILIGRIIFLFKNNQITLQRFLLFSIPYLIMIIIGGILWEIRLFVPVLLGMIWIAIMNYKKSNA